MIGAALIAGVLGCTTFGPVDGRSFVGGRRPAEVWVMRPDSSTVQVARPKMLGDTLVGFVEGKYQKFPPADVSQLKGRRPAPMRTALLVGGGLVTIGVVGILVSGGRKTEEPMADTGSARIALP